MNGYDIRNLLLAAVMSLCLSSIAHRVSAASQAPVEQDGKVTLAGRVVDTAGAPLPGTTVTLRGTDYLTGTDAGGSFSMRVPESANGYTLEFSFIGMEVQTRHIDTAGKPMRIVMRESNETVEEVVVTGMEVIRKERMTGSASVITSKDLRMQGMTSIDRILEGRIAGLNSETVSGAPGMRAKITIRGENNLSGNSEPLWIVDGLPMTQGVPQSNTGDYAGTIMQDGVGNIMPEDIESISILKDASAAAIYGARAANGVIVITTKKGFRSKMQVNYSGTYECSLAPANHMDFMNSAEKLRYEQSIVDHFGLDYAYNTGRGGYSYKRMVNGFMTPAEYDATIQRLSHINTDWFDVLFRTAHSHSHNVSLRGGSEEVSYYTSVNFQQKSGILLSNRYQSAGALIKLDYRPIKNLIIAMNVSASMRKNKDHASVINPFTYAMFANPYERPYDENGNYEADLSYLSDNYTTEHTSGYKYDKLNIVKEMTDTRSVQDGSDVELTFNLRYDILPGLSVESIFRKGVSYNTSTTEVEPETYTSWVNESFARKAYSDYTIMPSDYDNGELSEMSGKNHSWAIRNQIDYSFSIKQDHLFSLLVANEVVSRKFTNFGYTSPIYYGDYRITGIPVFDRDVSYEDMVSAIQNMFHTSDGQDRSVSFLGSLRYGYKDRYILNFNYRADGADIIGDSNRFTPLWSVGLRYNLHKEKFFANSVINELSLRASYGFTGNIDRSAYPFSTISFGSNMYQGDRFATQLTYPNPSVSWEKKRDRNIGLDMSLFGNRIYLSADYYFNETTDILENLEIPESTGRTEVKANGGVVTNKGVELYANIKWVNNSNLVFSTSFNMAYNKNVIKKSYYNYASFQEAIKSNPGKGGVINIIGLETGSIYGWKFAGVNPKTGNPQYYLTEEGKRACGTIFDQWDSYSDSDRQFYETIIGTPEQGIPDVVDFMRNDDTKQKSLMMSSMQYLGRSNPRFVGGFNTYLRYKNLEFTTSWTFKTGHIVPNFNDYQNAPGSGTYSSDLAVSSTNREKRYLYYWQFPGDVTDIPRFNSSGNDYWATMCTSANYSKGDYLRLTNLSLSYRFPARIIRRWGGIQNLSLGFNIRNLLTFTKYRGLDVGTGGTFTYPAAREFNIKLTVGF